ncbi:MAG: thioesterase family protein [Simkaniaceae bacterium]|nr:thioesterase family protein [Simkaniaceae bacterium]
MIYHRKIFLQDTDATGVIYFSQQLKISLEAFENFLEKSELPLSHIIREGDYLMPIVHVESNFIAPIRVNDALCVEMYLKHMGSSSFTLDFYLHNGAQKVGDARIVHCVMDREKGRPCVIPSMLKQILQTLPVGRSEERTLIPS